ncbi:ABC transporter substrate-binding protein [Lacinutrix sp. Hel_I_90]|uniref:ABC transporter substrate-binding protein n=1 Tax=Lacinutrix sp. Hel_I_90 TaxID=1249999 RepID=UPI0005C88BB4|nr:ABC transporter substrate-binding protein [Lacinutrix sp. Hel_I_90]
MKKIGVLLPQSKEYPTMGKEFMNGLKLTLPNADYSLVVEGIGFGNDPEHIINAIQKFVNQEDVHLTTGLMGHKGLDDILDFIEGIEEPFIYSDFGATCPLDLSKRENIYCNSLNLYDATRTLGKYFLDNGIFNIGTSTCYYESGYGFIEAMENALEKDKAGKFSGHFITPLHPRDNESELMSQFVSETKPDALFAFHNGIYAEEHATFLSENKINSQTPLYTLPFSVDDKILAKFPEIFNNTKCISSWFIDLETKENKKFIQEYQQKYNKTPSVFSVLGYENGLLIYNYLKNKNAFSSESIIGPRGELNNAIHKNNRTVVKQYLWNLNWVNNTYKFDCLEELKQTIAIDYLSKKEGNGWHNSYLCH